MCVHCFACWSTPEAILFSWSLHLLLDPGKTGICWSSTVAEALNYHHGNNHLTCNDFTFSDPSLLEPNAWHTAWRPTQEYSSHIIIITIAIAIIVIIIISWPSEPKTAFKHQTFGMCVGVGVKFPNTAALKPHHHWHCHNHHHHLTCKDFYVSDPKAKSTFKSQMCRIRADYDSFAPAASSLLWWQ